MRGSRLPVRADLLAAQDHFLEHVRSPGTWWTGAERSAIAAESRAADDCGLCRERKAALSPNGVSGPHEAVAVLSPEIVDVIHRVRTDPGRLSKAWFESVMAQGLAEGPYVELISVTTLAAGQDYVARALGSPPLTLRSARTGEPSRYRPTGAKLETAWVPMIPAQEVAGAEADLYDDGMVPNIERALSLVPDEVRALRKIAEPHYMGFAQIADPTTRLPHLDRLQMELVAARVSALNECFY